MADVQVVQHESGQYRVVSGSGNGHLGVGVAVQQVEYAHPSNPKFRRPARKLPNCDVRTRVFQG
jgi:hypothetical protein